MIEKKKRKKPPLNVNHVKLSPVFICLYLKLEVAICVRLGRVNIQILHLFVNLNTTRIIIMSKLHIQI